MFGFSKKHLNKPIGIDMGTARTRIYGVQGSLSIDEPSLVALRVGGSMRSKDILAFGDEASALGVNTVDFIRPLSAGAVVDVRAARLMLRSFIRRACRSFMGRTIRAVVAVPCDATQVEIRAVRQVVLRSGVSNLDLIDEPMAAALGAGLPVTEPRGSVVVAIGAGTTEIGVIALGGLIYKRSIRTGGVKLDCAVIEYIKRQHGIMIDAATADKLKVNLGSALPRPDLRELAVDGRRLDDGAPLRFTINSGEVLEALSAPLLEIATFLKESLAHVPPDLSADLTENGIVLTGGGALLPGIAQLLAREVGLPVTVANEPLLCAVRGCYLATLPGSQRSMLRND